MRAGDVRGPANERMPAPCSPHSVCPESAGLGIPAAGGARRCALSGLPHTAAFRQKYPEGRPWAVDRLRG